MQGSCRRDLWPGEETAAAAADRTLPRYLPLPLDRAALLRPQGTRPFHRSPPQAQDASVIAVTDSTAIAAAFVYVRSSLSRFFFPTSGLARCSRIG
ncbi:hypothetical protein GWI33_001551 [Rhynchophorus ferrugineus]|uniref:Uncharacterized protein n=1 Tax=Rhynchophorus ferrugineus TaxID=354439 RepID=A0A834IS04_RHYFE|nr:hypothetical protein GWI33_001551 [Rhynchophorus ferrugineus]